MTTLTTLSRAVRHESNGRPIPVSWMPSRPSPVTPCSLVLVASFFQAAIMTGMLPKVLMIGTEFPASKELVIGGRRMANDDSLCSCKEIALLPAEGGDTAQNFGILRRKSPNTTSGIPHSCSFVNNEKSILSRLQRFVFTTSGQPVNCRQTGSLNSLCKVQASAKVKEILRESEKKV